MLNLNLFDRRDNNKDDFLNNFISELKKVLSNAQKSGKDAESVDHELDDYNLYEKRKVFLDNKSFNGNELAWVMDDMSVCLSKNGDGGPYSLSDVDLPRDANVGDVFELVDGSFVFSLELTDELKGIR